MLGLTRESVRAIRELTEPESADGVRIHASSGRFSRANASSIQIEVADAPGVEDIVLEAEGARIYLDGETLRALDDKVLDADLTGDEPHFAVVRKAEDARQ
jgi:Fe-S cluster assembly iron-binding protein IscA